MSTEKRRLELSFTPDNVYSKPIMADCQPSNGLLMKVKMRRSRRNPDQPPEITYEMIGSVERTYKFTGICLHFQYSR